MSSGRIDKRQAILDAALTVFARDGYVQAGVDAIAAEAGVAKATVYNHFGDKETLLRRTFTGLAEGALARNLAAVDRLTGGGDPRTTLEDVAYRLLTCYCDAESQTMRRLLAAELHRFPDLPDIVRGQVTERVLQALADRMARMSVAGRLHTPDPELAAEQFTALLTAPADARTRLGTRRVPARELRTVAESTVDTFLKAFG